MDAIAVNSSTAWPSVHRSVTAPAILCSQFSSRCCSCQQKRSSNGLLLRSSFAYASNTIEIQAWTEIVAPLRRERRRRWSTEHGTIGGPSWQLKHDANSSPRRGEGNRNACGSRHSDSFWGRHEAPGSEAFAAARADRRKGQLPVRQQLRSVSVHNHTQISNSGGFFMCGKLEQGRNVWASPGGNVWAKKGENVWAREGLQAKLAEASLSREEASGAIETQQAATTSGYEGTATSTLVLDREPITGGAVDFRGATLPLTNVPLVVTKKIVLVRHGLSAWNAESRIQGSSDMSKLSVEGIAQAERCKQALANLKFSSCFASPISRAKTSAEVIWSGREEPLVFLDSLKEANLLFLEGMRNVDAKEQFPELYYTWREDPVNFHVNGVYPVVKLWAQAKEAWQEILSADGELVLVVTHKSILRALLCTALGMGPERFRAVDINNGGISVFTVNTRGEPMLQCLNLTAHLHLDGVFY